MLTQAIVETDQRHARAGPGERAENACRTGLARQGKNRELKNDFPWPRSLDSSYRKPRFPGAFQDVLRKAFHFIPSLREERTVSVGDWELELGSHFLVAATALNESTSEGRRGGRAYGELRLCDQTTMGQQLESTLE